jgi:uncharacterized protein YkwD
VTREEKVAAAIGAAGGAVLLYLAFRKKPTPAMASTVVVSSAPPVVSTAPTSTTTTILPPAPTATVAASVEAPVVQPVAVQQAPTPEQYNVDVINLYRAKLNLAPVVLDQALSDFAMAGSKEFALNQTPHAHFLNAGSAALMAAGFKTKAGENQASRLDVTQTLLQKIDTIQKTMFDEGPGNTEASSHYMNMMNPVFTRVGVALYTDGDWLYLTNDFSG